MATMFLGPVKAAVEELCGDEKGAEKTMDEFTKTNPIIAPIRLICDAVKGDEEDATETAETFCQNVKNIACSTPGLGHAIAVGYGIAGEEEKAEQTFLQATRTTAVAAAGIVGSVAGPAGAAAGGAVAGTLWDAGESAAGRQEKGVVKLIKACDNDTNLAPGEVFDSVMVPVGDAMTGVAASKMYDNVREAYKKNEAREEVQAQNDAKLEPLKKRIADQGVEHPKELAEDMSAKANELHNNVNKYESELRKIQQSQPGRSTNNYHKSGHVSCTMKDSLGNEATGYNMRLRDATETEAFEGQIPRLQQDNPTVQSVNGRPLINCAEQMAYEGCSSPTITYAMQIKDGIVKCVERCANCKQYPLGTVITDFMNGEQIPFDLPELPPIGSYYNGVVNGTILVAVQNTRKIPHT